MSAPIQQHFDVIIIGAGLSGIGSACHIAQQCPDKSLAILERRERMGAHGISSATLASGPILTWPALALILNLGIPNKYSPKAQIFESTWWKRRRNMVSKTKYTLVLILLKPIGPATKSFGS